MKITPAGDETLVIILLGILVLTNNKHGDDLWVTVWLVVMGLYAIGVLVRARRDGKP